MAAPFGTGVGAEEEPPLGSLLPVVGNESFCTVFWQAISESMDDSLRSLSDDPTVHQ